MQTLANVFEHSTDAVFGIDAAGVIQYSNHSSAEKPVAHDSNGYDRLSAREKEVLDLAAGGMTTSQIAGYLSISTLTVRTHFKNMYPKLGVNSRTEAVIFAIQNRMH